jgi:PAS domain S-box-containing protein
MLQGDTLFESAPRAHFRVTRVGPPGTVQYWDASLACLGAHLEQLTDAAFKTLVHFAPDAILVVDDAGRIVFVSAQVEQIFGYDRSELVGETIEVLVPERLRDAHSLQRSAYQHSPRARPMGSGLDLQGRRKDGSEFPVEISLSPLYTEEGRYVTAIVRDVTDRRRIEHALRDSEGRYRLLAENAEDIIFRIRLVPDRAVEYISPAVERVLGHAAAETTLESLLASTAVDDRRLFEAALDDPDSVRGPLSLRFLRRDGRTTWQELRITTVRDAAGRPMAIEGIARDVTERLRVEEEARALLAEAETQQERERIAVDLHDGVMQSIYAVGLDLRALVLGSRLSPEVTDRLDEAAAELNRAIADIRRYVSGLRPVHFNGDLSESIHNLARHIEANAGIEMSIELDATLRPVEELEALALFHIAQEALSNVRRHSGASTVRLALSQVGDVLELVVRDNGVGFEELPRPQEHMGLQNMERRARAAGGRFEIESAPGAGTTVRVALPVREPTPSS